VSSDGTPFTVQPGRPHPLGATPDPGGAGVNFSLYAGSATGVELLLFDGSGTSQPVQTILLDPNSNRSFLFWHVFVVGLQPGAQYAFRVDGPHDLPEGSASNGSGPLVSGSQVDRFARAPLVVISGNTVQVEVVCSIR